MEWIGDMAIPLLSGFLFFAAIRKRVNTFESFTLGAKEGLQSAVEILPSVLCLMTAVGVFRATGGVTLLCRLLTPLIDGLHIPEEILPLILLRPFSGSGSLSYFQNILVQYGPDSPEGFLASVLQSSGETVFYVTAIYSGAVSQKKIPFVIPCALFGNLVGVIAAVYITKNFFDF